MTTIWKFGLEVTDTQDIMMPRNAKVLSVQTQHGRPQLWAQVDPNEAVREPRTVFTFGTGHPIIGNVGNFIGTYQVENGALVFHVFVV